MQHWFAEQDAQQLVWLTFDKQGESTNTFSRQALEELNSALDEVRTTNPRGLVIRSAKDNFIAGADVNAFVNFKGSDEAIAWFQECIDTGLASDPDEFWEPMSEYELAEWRLGQLRDLPQS